MKRLLQITQENIIRLCTAIYNLVCLIIEIFKNKKN